MKDYTPATKKAIKLYENLGLPADSIIVIDGEIEEFSEGVNPQNTIYNKASGGHLAGKILIYNSVDAGYEEIAPHEMYHYFDALMDENATDFHDTIRSSLKYDSEKFKEFAERMCYALPLFAIAQDKIKRSTKISCFFFSH